MNEKNLDMTKGNPLSLFIRFALPLMAGNIFQQMYILVDTAIVGNGVGVEALASIGAADWLNWLVLGTASGFTQGFSILIAQTYGAKDKQRLGQAVKISFILACILSIILTVCSFTFMRPVLSLLGTPSEVKSGAIQYLTVIFGGIIITMMYNLFSGILRSLGDSKTPLIAMIIGAITNVILDCLFVYVFHLGITGAAIATMIAQMMAMFYCGIAVKKLKLFEMSISFDQKLAWHLLKLGIPVALQNLIISVGGLGLQSIVNGYGVNFIAGYTASNKLYGLLEFAAISYGYAVATYVGQNLGAKQYDRIRLGMKKAIQLSIVTSLAVSGLMIAFGKHLLNLFISPTASNRVEVLSVGYTYLVIMALFLMALFLLYMYRSALQGMGNTVIPMVSGIVELMMRLSIAMVLTRWIGGTGIFFGEVSAWMGAMTLLGFFYYRDIKKYKS